MFIILTFAPAFFHLIFALDGSRFNASSSLIDGRDTREADIGRDGVESSDCFNGSEEVDVVVVFGEDTGLGRSASNVKSFGDNKVGDTLLLLVSVFPSISRAVRDRFRRRY